MKFFTLIVIIFFLFIAIRKVEYDKRGDKIIINNLSEENTPMAHHISYLDEDVDSGGYFLTHNDSGNDLSGLYRRVKGNDDFTYVVVSHTSPDSISFGMGDDIPKAITAFTTSPNSRDLTKTPGVITKIGAENVTIDSSGDITFTSINVKWVFIKQ